MKFFVIFALALATASAYETAVPLRDLVLDELTEGRITNGQPAALGQFPYQVSLSYLTAAGSYVCGGSIISPNYVLTAAHCTAGTKSGTVYYGSTQRTGGKSASYSSGSITQHSGYNPNTLNNDISLIRVALTLGGNVAAIKLPARSSTYSTYAGSYALISGYGRTSDTGSVSNTQNWARAQIITNAVCQNTYGSTTVNGGCICISTPNGVSTCQGDSGGPLALEGANTLVGVTSFVSSRGCTSGLPSGFARVTYFRDWIYEKTGL